MARMRTIADRVERLLDRPVVATTPVAGGDICTSTRLRLSDGTSVLAKTRPHPPEGFFAVEAAGLHWLAEAEALHVPSVRAVEPDCLVLDWVEPTRATAELAAVLGRGLAALHRAGAASYGAATEGFIGLLPLPNRPLPNRPLPNRPLPNRLLPDWAEFFAVRRVLPYLALARDRDRIGPEDGAAVESVVRRLPQLAGPEEPPARLHGDLWSGNVVWSAEHGPTLVDPAAHGGHRETDLAMLALFGVPELGRVLAAYDEEYPLADGWQQRRPVHQLFPLLVHAALFGGRYGAMAGDAARKALAG